MEKNAVWVFFFILVLQSSFYNYEDWTELFHNILEEKKKDSETVQTILKE